MKETEQYISLKHPDQVEMMDYIIQSMGVRGKELMDQYKDSISKLNSSDLEDIKQKNNTWNESFKQLIIKNIQPNSASAQDLIKENYKNNVLAYYKPSHEEFIQLIELTTTHPLSKRKHDDIHPDFSHWFLQAAKYFVSSGAIDNMHS